MKKILLFLCIASFNLAQLIGQAETFGTVSGTTAISSHTGYLNSQVTYSGTGDLRTTSASMGYTGASGGANVFLTNGSNRSLTISSINILNGATSGQLCFGVLKSTTASDGSELSVTALNASVSGTVSLPTGMGTAIWSYVCLDIINITSNEISIIFTNTGTTPQFRLDDISLSNSVLPIKLQSFNLSKINKSTKINWTTTYENASSHFLIQRSFDGVSFETIGQIKSVGNSKITNNYSFLDEQPKKGNNYYRLVQVDIDGTKNTYKTEMMHMPYEKGFDLLNTVLDQSNSELIIRSDVEKYNISIYSITGHKVMDIQNMTYDQNIDTRSLSKGTYLIHLEGNGEISSLKFIKN